MAIEETCLIVKMLRESVNTQGNGNFMVCVKIAEDSKQSAIPELELFIHSKNIPLPEGSFEIKETETLDEITKLHFKDKLKEIARKNLIEITD